MSSCDGTGLFEVELRDIVRHAKDRGNYTDITLIDEELLKLLQEPKGLEID